VNNVSKYGIRIAVLFSLLCMALLAFQAAPKESQVRAADQEREPELLAAAGKPAQAQAQAAGASSRVSEMRQKALRAYKHLNLDKYRNIYLKPFFKMAKEGPARTLKEGTMLTMEATGYDASAASTGDGDGITASLTPFREGVAAVDPRIIPIGTILYVEGYGYARAEDTGGVIKGYRIDLAFPDRNDAFEWGRRNVRITVLAVPDLSRTEIEYPILGNVL